jgi:putative glutamine amidotransferase
MSVGVPSVWVVASHRMLQNQSGHIQRYTVTDESGQLTLLNMGLQPVCYPRVPPERIEGLLATVDGLLLGGSDTNVHPSLYGELPHPENDLFDEERDALVQPLIRLALQHRVPLISFCRGSHDFNVTLGGSLHQCLEERPHGIRHWEDPDENIDEQYRERHFVSCMPGGELERIAGQGRFAVSSLHRQGAAALGQGLVAEAHADDGLVEAFRWHDASLFAWGFQFHPEWNWRVHPAYNRIMNAYVQACWQRLGARTAAPLPAAQIPLPLETA